MNSQYRGASAMTAAARQKSTALVNTAPRRPTRSDSGPPSTLPVSAPAMRELTTWGWAGAR